MGESNIKYSGGVRLSAHKWWSKSELGNARPGIWVKLRLHFGDLSVLGLVARVGYNNANRHSCPLQNEILSTILFMRAHIHIERI